MKDIKAAITEVETDIPVAIQNAVSTGDSTAEEMSRKPKAIPGQIGEGKQAPLRNSQRKRALQTERLRIPLILSNPEYAANPFKTIRTHAQNTLIKHGK